MTRCVVELVVMERWLISLCLQGQASDIAIQAREILKMRDSINQLYVKHCKQDIKDVGMYCWYHILHDE